MRVCLERGNIIGGVNCIFLKKSWHIYKARTYIEGLAITRKGWKELEEEDPAKCNDVKKKILIAYLKKVRTPLVRFK